MLWQNGGDNWIQRIEKVQKHPFTKISDCSSDASAGGEVCWGGMSPKIYGDVFACRATSSDATAYWIVRLDSARQIGLESTLQDFLIVGGCGFTEWEKR